MQPRHFFSFLTFSILLTGCSDWFEFHPYDGRIKGRTNINATNIERIESICQNKDTIRFVLIGDTQRSYNDTDDFVKLINQRNDIDFIIHGGDVADFGLTKEFLWMRDILEKIRVPYVTLLGNHDCLANGKEIFEQIYGEVNFSFHAGEVKFVCLNTNAIEFDYSVPVPDFEFIEKELEEKREGHKKTIVAMHAPPFNEQFNNNVARVFHRYIKEFPDLLFCMHAHTHHLSENDFFDDGTIYYGCKNIAKRNYLLFTITPDDYSYEAIDF